jgi:membrane-bound lytic murein transglycosylase B
MSWPLLAAIGRVESDHGRAGGAVLRVDGTSSPRTIGPALNGVGTARIPATPLGQTLDGDAAFDHAVGPMQIIPSTWLAYRTAATGHNTADPFNIYDAAVTAARYLCAAAGVVTTQAGVQQAVTAYNHSSAYVATVLALETIYAAGGSAITIPTVAPTTPAPLAPPAASPTPTPTWPSTPTKSPTPTPTASPSPTTTAPASPTGSVSTSPTAGGSSSPTPKPSPSPTSVVATLP